MSDLQEVIEDFVAHWGPKNRMWRTEFINQLRSLLEAYGRAALAHESLPDTEHEHGEPA